MRGSSPESQPWWELTLDWPVEHVPCQLVVVEPRRLTALEWALLRVLEEFGDEPPPLQEIVEELGLGEPRFLVDTLRSLLTLEALTPRPGVTESSQLGDTLFTERGRELFRKGQIDGKPQTQGHALCFDPFTDESFPLPEKVLAGPRCPVVPPGALSAPREDLGLDRVRSIVRRFGIPVGGADAWIRSARIFPQGEVPSGLRSGHHWVGHPVALVPTEDGRFHLRTPTLTAEQRKWLLGRRFDSWADGSRATTVSWTPHRSFRRNRHPFMVWRETVEQIVPVSQVSAEALRLVASARREVLLHAAWAAAPGMQKALLEAAERGVAVYVPGSGTTRITAWSTSTQHAPGFIVEAAFPDELPATLVVDGSEALLLDEVLAGVNELGQHALEVTGHIRARAPALQLELRRALLGSLPTLGMEEPPRLDVRRLHPVDFQALLREPALQMALARLNLFPDPATWTGIERWVSGRFPGAERVEALRYVAELAGRLVPENAEAPWRRAWPEAWRTLLAATSAETPEVVPDGVLRALFRLAPPQVTPLDAIDPLVAHWLTPAPATRDPEPLRELTRLRTLAEERWEQGAASRCPGFGEALAHCLEVVAPVPEGHSLATLAGLIGRLVPAERARRWGESVADTWLVPRGFHEFETWRKLHEPLHGLLGPELERRMGERWKALARVLRARTAEDMTEPLRHARGLLSAHEAAEILLAAVELPTLVDRVGHLAASRLAFERAWKEGAPRAETWNQRLHRLLTVPEGGFSPESHVPLVSEIARVLQNWPGADAALRTWVRALVESLPPPNQAEGVAWWMDSVRGVSRFLGADLQPLASAQVRRHLGTLRDAQRENTFVWQLTAEAWRELGLEAATLDALLVPPPAPTAEGHRKNKNRRKQR
jgi:hypothetical protein